MKKNIYLYKNIHLYNRNSLAELVNFSFFENKIIFLLCLHWENRITWTFKHIHAFSFSDLNTSFTLLDKEKVGKRKTDFFFSQKLKKFTSSANEFLLHKRKKYYLFKSEKMYKSSWWVSIAQMYKQFENENNVNFHFQI